MDVLAFLAKLQHIPESSMRQALMREALMERSPAFGATMLGALVERCLLGAPPGEDALLALVPVLLDVADNPDLYEAVRNIYEVSALRRGVGQGSGPHHPFLQWDLEADESSSGVEPAASPPEVADELRDGVLTRDPEHIASLHAVVCNLLMDPPPHRLPPKRQFKFGPRWERDVTLGERKAFAAGGNRIYLERLVYDGDPAVVEKLCSNPRIVEQDVMLIVTRRPVKAELLTAVAQSRWLSRYPVRKAIILNPFNRTGLSLRLVPLLHGHDLRALSFVEDVHPMVRETAKQLVLLREHLGAP